MLRTKLLQCVSYNTTKIFMSTSAETAAFENKLEHYKNLHALDTSDTKPQGWDEAKPFESIPGPKPIPILGNMWRFVVPKLGDFYGKDFLDIHRELNKQYGEISILRGLLGKSIVVLFNPKDFEMLFRNEGVWPIRDNIPSLEKYQDLRKDIHAFGLATRQGESWFKFRSVVNPILMQPKNIARYTDKMNLIADELIDNMKYFAEQNKDGEMPEEFRNEIYKWSLESVAVVTMDTHLGCLKRDLKADSEPQKMINNAIQFFELMYKLDFRPSLYKYFNTPDWKQYVSVLDFLLETNIKHLNRALDNLAKEETNTENEVKSVLQQMLKKDKDTAVSMAMDMMFAGIDTTGRILGAGLYYLGKNPEKLEQLRNEAKALLKDKDTPITKEVLAKAPYLKAVVKEVTRLAPIGVGNMRRTQKNLVLGGYQIPKGTDVMSANLVLSLNDEHFPKAKEFLPERWLSQCPADVSHKSANPFIWAPFGFGPRSCIGKRLANLELEVAFLKVARNFDIKWPHEDIKFATAALYGIAGPLKIHVKTLDD